MIERETIEKLIQLMVDHDLVELDVEDGDQSIKLKRAGAFAAASHAAHHVAPLAPPHHAAPLSGGVAHHHASSGHGGGGSASSAAGGVGGGGSGAASADAIFIKSPMVGTYYSKPDPDSDPFVAVGTNVSDSTVVCLVEAMKVFNEIKAERSGRIAEILVKDGDPVEYGQPLFRLDT